MSFTKENDDYDEKQLDDARQLCRILKKVPEERRKMFLAIINAYADGMVAGEAIASSEKFV